METSQKNIEIDKAQNQEGRKKERKQGDHTVE